MTIKEMEALSGMTRANIRFYESEGLLHPTRGENGYRNYTQTDLQELERIRLLRTLEIPLEEIKQLRQGDRDLRRVLQEQLTVLKQTQEALSNALSLCQRIYDDGATYQTLDAQKYLQQYVPESQPAVTQDVLTEYCSPWRRYFARLLDYALYAGLWNSFLALVFRVNLAQRSAAGNLLDTACTLGLMLLLEPLLLHLFSTTPGKWILGIRVTDPEGDRLSYSEGRSRTLGALWWGMGFQLPIFSLVRLWISHRDLRDDQLLPWEWRSRIRATYVRPWRYALAAGVWALSILLSSIFGVMAGMPVHRGDITVSQFCENFTQLSQYHGIDYYKILDDHGRWVEPGGTGVVISMEDSEHSNFQFQEENGVVTAVSFTVTASDSIVFSGEQDRLLLTAMAFGCTEDGFGIFSGARERMLNTILEHPFESFRFSEGGILMECQVEYTGYRLTAGTAPMLIATEEGPAEFSLTFTISKT